jgi:hypothetical protein
LIRLAVTSARKEGLKVKSQPTAAANIINSKSFKKIVTGLAVWIGSKQESIKIPNAIKKEAMAERTMGLTDFRMLVAARRDRIVVTAR